MGLRRTSHAVYDTKYHLVWAPKYRKWILRGDIQERVKELFQEIAEHHGFLIDTLEVAPDHVHIFLSFPPRYSISKVVGMLKSISASEIFKEHPEVKKQLWGGEFWEDGYFVRTVGDKVTAEIIRKYIKHHQEQKKSPEQLELF
jgi:putative transposase